MSKYISVRVFVREFQRDGCRRDQDAHQADEGASLSVDFPSPVEETKARPLPNVAASIRPNKPITHEFDWSADYIVR